MAQNKMMVATPLAPAAIGPYSQAVRVGDMVFTSGQVALDPETGALVAVGIREQTTRVLDNLTAVLGEAGLDLEHVVKTTVYLKNMADFTAMNEVYAAHFALPFPARTTIGVAALPLGARIEIEMIARKG